MKHSIIRHADTGTQHDRGLLDAAVAPIRRHWLTRRTNGAAGPFCFGLLFAAMNASAHNPHDPVLGLGVSPNFSNDHTLFLSSFPAMNWSYKDILRSTDGGASWTKLPNGIENRSDFSAIRVSPNYSADSTVYAATRGEGVYRSTNQGNSWQLINTGLTNTGIRALKIGGSATDYVLFAATSAGALFRRPSSAGAWVASLAAADSVISYATSPEFSQNGTVIAADSTGRLRVSTDGGVGWTVLGNPVATAVYDIAIAPGGAREIFLATSSNRIFYSNDGGVTFVNKGIGLPAEAVNHVAVSPNYANDHTVFCTSVTHSVYKSVNSGKNWTLYNSNAHITHQAGSALGEFLELQVSSAYASDSTVFFSAYDGLFQSTNGGVSWGEIQTRKGIATGLAFSPEFAGDGRVLATVYSERGLYSSADSGAHWSLAWNGWPAPGGSLSAFDVDFVANHVGPPLAVATRNHSNIGFSSDFGANWQVLPLPRLPATAPQDVYVTSLGLSPVFDTDREIYVGTRTNGVLQTLDGGSTWRRTLTTPTGQITKVAVSPDYASDRTVFAGALGGQVWRSIDGGGTWARVGSASINTRGGLKYTWVSVSPRFAADRLVLVGTNNGIYRSTDGGTSWQPIGRLEIGASRVIQQIEFAPPSATNPGLTFYAVVRGRGMMRVELDASAVVASVTNVGTSLLAQNLEFADFRLSPSFETDGTLIGVSDKFAYLSNDGGVTWSMVGQPAGSN